MRTLLPLSAAAGQVRAAPRPAFAIDENDDGNFCLKDVSNLRGESGKHWAFFYSARDNDTAAS